jgi:hypothetical protein
VSDTARNVADATRLEALLREVTAAPKDSGTLELIVARPAEDAREVLARASLDSVRGLDGDSWWWRVPRGRSGPDPDAQVTIVNSRAINAIAGGRERWPLAGDQLYVDLDISIANFPPGSRIRIGSAVLEFGLTPHTGCRKFAERYGRDALRLVMSPRGREHRLRGANCTIVVSGVVQTGDAVTRSDATGA